MTKREFILLAFRLLAVYVVLRAILGIAQLTEYIANTTSLAGETLFVLFMGLVGLPCLLAWALVAKSEWLTERIIRSTVQPLSISSHEQKSSEAPDESELFGGKDEILYRDEEAMVPGEDAIDENGEDAIEEDRLTLSTVGKVAFSAIGALVLATSLPNLIVELVDLGAASTLEPLARNTIFANILRTALGTFLLLGSSRLQEWIDFLSGKRRLFSEDDGTEGQP